MSARQTFITVEDARRRILSHIPTLPAEQVFLKDALGRPLREAVEAPEDAPRFDNSSRDGYALRWEDIADGEATLEVVGTTTAGQTADRRVEAGQAVRIMTGAPVPDGADTVVMQENVETDEDGSIHVPTPPSPGRGAWIRRAGSYLKAGEAVLERGDRLSPADLGLLASFGRSRLGVGRRPRVAIVSTGDELVEIDRRPGDGQIINSNAHLLESLVRQADATPVVFPIAPDRAEQTRSTFRHALQSADLVVSSGGVSVGTHDVVRDIVDELTGGMNFWKIRMKPGKPLAFGTTVEDPHTPLIGLPGNPNSCFVGFHQFVRPALRVAEGGAPDRQAPARLKAHLGSAVSSTPHRRQYLAGRLETPSADADTRVFIPFDRQASGNVALFCGADAFGLVPEGVDEMEKGATIDVEPI